MGAKRAKRTYSDEERGSMLAALAANGGNVNLTSKQTGVPEATLRHWSNGDVRPHVVKIGERKKLDLASLYDGFVGRVLKLTTDADIKKASLRDRFTAAGIATDKGRLLRGEPTGIMENREPKEMTTDELRADIAADEAAEAVEEKKRAAGADGGGPVPPPVHPLHEG